MFSKQQSPSQSVLVACIGFFLTFCSAANADDIEIYSNIFDAGSAIGNSPEELNPNILFILDNSGSMGLYALQRVVGSSSSYNSSESYGNSPAGNVYIYDSNMNYSGEFVTDAQNQCQAQRDWVANNPDNPRYYDQVAQWHQRGSGDYRWNRRVSSRGNDSNNIIDCAADRGVHSTVPSTTSFPSNCDNNRCASSVPRYLDSAERDPFSTRYNLVSANFHDFLQARRSQGQNAVEPDPSNCTSFNDVLLGDDGQYYECNSRMQVMQTALNNALDSFNDVNVGLMDFNRNVNGNHGGTLRLAVKSINSPGVRNTMKNTVNAMTPDGNTPLAETMSEAARYFSGANRLYGEPSRDDNDGLIFSGGPTRYKSPIVNECQDNNIVLLSDGEPTSDTNANNDIASLIGRSCSGNTCLDELSGWMASNDLSNSVRGDNPVYTYTIGFAIDTTTLSDAADAGRPPGAEPGSGYFQADDILELENAFRTIVGQIQEVDADTFVAPAVTVNAFNRLQNREDVYYVVFKPSENARWNGNLKKYRVTADAKIVDANNNDAISETTGFFKDEAKSFWSAEADGASVIDGGMSAERTNNRALYANLDAGSNAVTLISDSSLADSVDEFIEKVVDDAGIDIGQTGVTAAQLEDNAKKVAAWTIGADVNDENGGGVNQPNYFVGDNVHGQPYVLSYGTSDADPRDLIFFTSNQGMLHAVTGADRNGVPGGTEAWAYVPDPDLFSNFGDYFNRTSEKVYGLDAEMSFSVQRNPSSNAVTKAHLFFGQRRGGNKLFAVDVTNAVSAGTPVSKLWTIEGGSGDFDRLGQTWSEPVVAKINYCQGTNCGLKDVIIFSGGYDEAYDDPSVTAASRSGSVLGNAIYIVDAANGALLWMASSTVEDSNRDLVIPEMTHSIPSKPTALDVTKDGATDILFFTDIAGQVFRIDFKASPTGDNSISSTNNASNVAGGMIADLSEASADRRFFNPVDVALLPRDASGAPARYALVTGSGYRAKPLEAESFGNRLYVIHDQNIFEPLYDEDLDASLDGDTNQDPVYLYATNAVGQPSVIDMDVAQSDLGEVNATTPLDLTGAHEYGFYANVTETAEKLITPTLISDFRAIAVSYIPADRSNIGGNGSQSGTCSAGVGTSNAYEFNLLTGELEKTELVKPGLTAEPVVIYVLETDPDTGEESLKPIVIIGTEPFEGEEFDLTNLKLGKAEKRAWWERGRSN
ncbi:type IV pili system adhesin PilY [Arenicella chitinivorans]|uniref:Type IV pili system adhesin PilY n=1 Tax=Arenicella chitinivorans TaxID=1329800 RepID=A0A918RQJ9_9GAMM|nr:PilC/PilY family type IV pilus protein [Arenicella chitinivorans]GHA07264.1 type IV pili system adhesin PilY [Arenicella chitinivorans]